MQRSATLAFECCIQVQVCDSSSQIQDTVGSCRACRAGAGAHQNSAIIQASRLSEAARVGLC